MAQDPDSRIEKEEPTVAEAPRPKIPKDLESIAEEVDTTARMKESQLERKTSFMKKALDVVSFAGSMYIQSLIMPASLVWTSLVPMYGFIRSKLKGEKKEGKPFTWNKFVKSANLGQRMGYGDIAVFSLPDVLIKLSPALFSTGAVYSFITKNSTLLGLIAGTATTLAFNPLMIPAYNLVYTTLTYFRDKVGYGKALLQPWKIPKYFRHMYHTEVKGKWIGDTKNIFKYLFPLHWLQFVVHPFLITRLLQSIFINNKIYADAMTRVKGKAEKVKEGYQNVKDRTGEYLDRAGEYIMPGKPPEPQPVRYR